MSLQTLTGSTLPGNYLRPHATVILASSVDGKIADRDRSPARFGSPTDKHHLETQISQADAVLFGAATLRAYGTTLRIHQPALLAQRQAQGKPPQPVQIVCSASGNLDRQFPFFQQPVPRWLLTTPVGAQKWQNGTEFDRVLTSNVLTPTLSNRNMSDRTLNDRNMNDRIDWHTALQQLSALGIDRLAVLGGGELVASLIEAAAIDEVWITLCPLILGGNHAPTLVEGMGFVVADAPQLELLEVEAIADEVFLHYRIASKRGVSEKIQPLDTP
jgi:5-amino-6-(5-phosphoribosylamino)uracil reductase